MIEAWILTFAMILVRVATFWMIIPIWSSLKPPRMVKLGLILSLSIFWFTGLSTPVQSANVAVDAHWAMLALMIMREILTGGILGFAFHAFFVPMQIAGAYIGQELGLSMATLTDPATGAINNILATMLQAVAICLFFILDFHHFIIYLLDGSFRFLPVGSPVNMDAVMVAGFQFAEMTQQGLAISMPIAIVMFVAMVALLVLARAVPALNLFSVGMSIRLLLGLLAILFFLPHLLTMLFAQFDSAQQFLEKLAGSL